MGDATHHQQQQRQITSSRLGMRSAGGEIVEVQGGHIVRSIGRKDRHSKVCTAKGPRDRRVRLSAHTAIQFYDVQDRLGYDRPSKAVDWLIKKAKAAIDELEELPAWKPTIGSTVNSNFQQEDHGAMNNNQEESGHQQQQLVGGAIAGSSSKRPASLLEAENEVQAQQLRVNHNNNPIGSSQSFLPPSLDSDAIADTIKAFFPMGTAESNSSAMQFQSFPTTELLSRRHSQDLRLSLQSFQDPVLLHHHQNPQTHHLDSSSNDDQSQSQSQVHSMFSATGPLGFDVANWPENQPATMDTGRFHRMAGWYGSGDTITTGGGGVGFGGFTFNSPPTPPLFGQTHFFSQRGSLQSSNTPSVRAWMDQVAAGVTIAAASDHHHHQFQHHHSTIPIHLPSFAGFELGSGMGGFRIPARIQGDEEEHDGLSDKPSSASSESRH